MDFVLDLLSDGRIVLTTFTGAMTDDALDAYGDELEAAGRVGDQRPGLVDGRSITRNTVTPQGIERLTSRIGLQADPDQGRCLALVADRDLVYGMFRKWELQRQEAGDDVRVFRDYDAALVWLEEIA